MNTARARYQKNTRQTLWSFKNNKPTTTQTSNSLCSLTQLFLLERDVLALQSPKPWGSIECEPCQGIWGKALLSLIKTATLAPCLCEDDGAHYQRGEIELATSSRHPRCLSALHPSELITLSLFIMYSVATNVSDSVYLFPRLHPFTCLSVIYLCRHVE